MKKALFTFIVTLGILVIGASGSYIFRVPIINHSLTNLFSVPVEISIFDVVKNKITIENVVIDNPETSAFPYAMKIGSLELVSPIRNYFRYDTEIKDIYLNDVEVNVEFYDKKNTQMNWDPIVASSNYIISSPIDEEGSIITIQKFVITRLKVNLKQSGQKVETFYFNGPLVYRNLDSRRGIPSRVVADVVVRITLQKVFSLAGLTEFAGVIFKGAIKPITEILPFHHFSEKKRKPLQ
jgi:hypothetical protein